MAYAITQKVEQVERKRRTREREPEKEAKKKEKRKACNTGRSRVVSHHSTLPAQRSLTAESGRDPVFSPWYDRRQHPLPRSALCTARQPGFHHPRKQAEPTVSPTHGLPQPTLVFAPFTDRTTKASTPQMTSPIGLKMKRGTSFTFNAQSAPGPLTMAAAVSMVWHARVQESCL